MKIKGILTYTRIEIFRQGDYEMVLACMARQPVAAVLNASIGLLEVVVSLAQVWAVKHAIDVASHVVSGSIYWAVGIMGLFKAVRFRPQHLQYLGEESLGIKAQNRMQQQMPRPDFAFRVARQGDTSFQTCSTV